MFFLLLILAVGIIVGTFWLLSKTKVGRGWWLSAWVLIVLGVTLGILLNLNFDYAVGNDYRIIGVPFPFVVLHLEDGHWVDYVSPFLLIIFIVNTVTWGAALILPVAFACVIRSWLKKRPSKFRLDEDTGS